jgi:predicted metal-dependent hydrolase
VVTEWLGRRALEDARSHVERRAPRLGRKPTSLRIGDQKTLWGSCSSRGAISLNWRLVAAPPAVFEYVVVHELCHLVERNHGEAFWQLVGELMPDYREHRSWLKKHGVALR